MSIVFLQSKDEFDRLAKLDTGTGEMSWFSRTTDPEVASRQIQGHAAEVHGRTLCLYREQGLLQFRIDEEDIVLTDNTNVELKQLGDEAEQIILAAHESNHPPPPGKEYLLVKLRLASTANDGQVHDIDDLQFGVTGSRLLAYKRPGLIEPEPRLDTRLFAGAETVGWLAYSISAGEEDLMFTFDKIDSHRSDLPWFMALEEGASVPGNPPGPSYIEPSLQGKDRNKPVPFGEMAITADWQLTVLDVVRGHGAWEMIQEASDQNAPPRKGMEYVLASLRVRYIGQREENVGIDNGYFRASGSSNVIHGSPRVVEPYPSLDGHFYPGGELEGWVAAQVAIGEASLSLFFDPLDKPWCDMEVEDHWCSNKRFLSLEQ